MLVSHCFCGVYAGFSIIALSFKAYAEFLAQLAGVVPAENYSGAPGEGVRTMGESTAG
jgi:hypothetical protein